MGTEGYRVGMAQILVEGGRPEANLARAADAVREAAAAGCRLVVLPECLDCGWTDPSARHLARPIPGPHADVPPGRTACTWPPGWSSGPATASTTPPCSSPPRDECCSTTGR
jgi:hypothetical protein